MKIDLPEDPVECQSSDEQVLSAPLVSVVMLTYNHEHFIEQAVRGVMDQISDFPFELIVAEDCSTDATRDLTELLKKKDPGKIKLLLSEKNVGVGKNLSAALKSAKAKYIALCDGDDQWFYKYKLRDQVKFLETNKSPGGCYHNGNMISADGEIIKSDFTRSGKLELTFRDILRGKRPTPTSSLMIRNPEPSQWPDWMDTQPLLDAKVAMLGAMQGPIHYMDFTGVSYRIHRGGYWTGKDNVEKLKFRIRHMDSLIVSKDPRIEKCPLLRRRLSYTRQLILQKISTAFYNIKDLLKFGNYGTAS